MSASNFHLRNVSPRIMSLLKKKAAKQNISINSLLLQIIEQGLGITCQTKRTVFHDLDHLAGTWSDKDKRIFDDNIKSFENINKEL